MLTLYLEKLDLDIERKCKVCGFGKYIKKAIDNNTHVRNFGFSPAGSREMRIFVCDHCGNVQIFSHTGIIPSAWSSLFQRHNKNELSQFP